MSRQSRKKRQSRCFLQALRFEYPVMQPHTLFGITDPREIEFE